MLDVWFGNPPNCTILVGSMKARKLEGELDVKLAAYVKICSGFEANYRLKSDSSLGADQVCRHKPLDTLYFEG